MTEKVNVPKLRFCEFEGEWNEVDISSLGKIVTGSTPPTSDPSNYLGDRLFISPADLDGRKYISSTKTTLSQKGFDTGRLLPSGSVCFVCIGSTIGKVAINSEDAISNQQINAVVVNHKKYDSDFVYSRLIKDSPRIKLLAGEQAVPILNKSSFGKVKVFTPPLQEQQKIASFFSKVDEKIALLTEKKAKLTEYKKGVMQQLFNGKWEEQEGQLTFIPPTLRFKSDDGSEFPDWEEKKLGELGQFKNGLNKGKEDFGFGSPFVNLQDVFGKQVISSTSNLGLVNASDKDIDLYQLLKGDVIFIRSSVKKSGVGETALVEKNLVKTVYSGFLIRFRSNTDLTDNYKKYCFWDKRFRNKLIAMSTTSANTNINQESLSQLTIPCPSQDEQTKIANFLSSIDQKIDLVSSELEKAKEWKKGLLQQMFV